jgi:hypothetical protein
LLKRKIDTDYTIILYSIEVLKYRSIEVSYVPRNEDDFELRHDVLEFLSAYAAIYTFPRTDFSIFWVVFSCITAASSFESDIPYIPWKVDYGSAIYILVSGRQASTCHGNHAYKYSNSTTGEKWGYIYGAGRQILLPFLYAVVGGDVIMLMHFVTFF